MSQFSSPWYGHALISSLNHSYASKRDFASVCLKHVIWFPSCIVLLDNKYIYRNTFLRLFHVVMEFYIRDYSHALALSLRDIGNKMIWMTCGLMPLHLRVSVNCTKIERCKFGSSIGFPHSWFNCIREGFNIKLFTAMTGRTMLEWGSSSEGTIKSFNGRW